MPSWFESLGAHGPMWPVVRAAAIFVVTMLSLPVVRRALPRMLGPRLGLPMTMLIQRLLSTVIVGVASAWTLKELGFDLNVLLGTAGILGVALSISSQTSIGQLISGLFIIWEKPFSVGDTIQVDDTTGEVLAVDPLSVKLRTNDNLFVRIPNETILKGKVSNLTRFPIRRCDIELGVALEANVEEVRAVLLEVAERNLLCLEDPKPLFVVLGYAESSLRLQFSPWSNRENFLDLKNSIYADIKQAFDRHGISLPYPHRTVVVPTATRPLPVQVLS